MRRKEWQAYGFLFPALILLALFTVFPLLVGCVLSFFHYNVVTPPRFAGLANFILIFHDGKAKIALEDSLLYLLVVPVLQLLSILMAILVNKEIKGMSLFRACFYIPVVTSIVVVALAWKWFLADDGIFNGILISLHLMKTPIHWLTDPGIALYSVMLVTLWKGIGYYMVLYLAGLQAVDPQFEEAAAIDGASPLQVFWKVTLPLLKPIAAFCTMISCIAALKVFAEVYVMTNGGPLASTTTMVYYIYDTFMNRLNMGYASALGMVLAVVIGALSFVNYRFFKEGGFESY